MKFPWSRFYWSDFLSQTSRLSNEELGAYMRLQGDLWINEKLPDGDRELAHIARSSPYRWRKIKPAVAKFFHDGWCHEWLENERKLVTERYEKKASSGRAGGQAKARNAASNATSSVERRQSDDMANIYQSEPEPDSSSHRSDETGVLVTFVSSKAKRKGARPEGRLRRIADDALPNEKQIAHAIEIGWDRRRIWEEWQKFRDYHLGRGSKQLDWNATWRTWCRNAGEFTRNATGAPTSATRNPAIAATEKILKEMDEHDRNQTDRSAGALPHAADGCAAGGLLSDGAAANRAPTPILDLEAQRSAA